MIQKPNVTFYDAAYEGEALASVDETGVTTTGGKHIDADVIIWATVCLLRRVSPRCS